MKHSDKSSRPRRVRASASASKIAFITPPPYPLLKASMACLVRREPLWPSTPRCARPQNPKNSVRDSAVVPPRPTSSIRSPSLWRAQPPRHFPLFIN